MAAKYVELLIDVFDDINQRAQVKRSLTVDQLMRGIFKEFGDQLETELSRYRLYLHGKQAPLPLKQTLHSLSLLDEDHLEFFWADQSPYWDRHILSNKGIAMLIEEKSGTPFPINWQPAIIGRPTGKPEQDQLLCVNLTDFPKAIKVSRRHAELTELDGQYFIELIADQNPIMVNGAQLLPGRKVELESKDKIVLVRSQLILHFDQNKTEFKPSSID